MKTSETYLLAEALFSGAFANNPKQDANTLIDQCLAAAVLYDQRIEALKGKGLAESQTAKAPASKAAPKAKRAQRKN